MNIRLIKGFVIALVGLFVFITLLSLFIPSKVMISRGVVIHAGAAKVFDQVNNLSNWKNWQPVFKNDSAHIRFSNDSAQWISKNKTNTITITSRSENSISASIEREGENTVLNTIRILPLADSNQVQAEWNILIKLKWYPWEKFYGIFIEKITGQGYEDALNGLKVYCEGR
ncbi:MAG TPA: hypothetical protein PKC54_16535 [Ferruginibacter sp.]|nr:hypothetical protein [Ferruginibacter sp.]